MDYVVDCLGNLGYEIIGSTNVAYIYTSEIYPTACARRAPARQRRLRRAPGGFRDDRPN